jgi:VWFA-related protein
MSRSRFACYLFLAGLQAVVLGQQTSVPQDPTLTHRPAPQPAPPPSPFTAAGSIHLDVMVNDDAGKPVLGLQPWDFKLLDDGQPRKILSFHSFDGITVKPDPTVQVILVIDTANLPFQQVAFVQQAIVQFLRENGGHLAQPVSIMLLTDAGLRVQPRPSVDGNALVGVVQQIKGSMRTIDTAMGGEGLLERFQLSAHAMETIAENEATRPGRKLLIWVGPGWPMLTTPVLGYYSEKNQRRYFDAIVELSTKLREARTVVYSVAPANPGAGGTDSTYTLLYQDYVKGVKSAEQAAIANLALKVLVTQTGGKILGPDNNLAAQIDSCIADANAFYTLSFDPPRAKKANEYHDLKVEVSKPGATARTNTGYYDQP